MLSKNIFFRCSLIFLCAVMTWQCSPKVGEEPPKQPEQKIAGTQCLPAALDSFVNFANGVSTDDEVAQAFQCGRSALLAFKRYVRGRENERYTTQELAAFIEQNFLNDPANASKFKSTKISPELQLEVMKIKQLLIGGTVNDLTFPELDQLMGLLDQLSGIALSLNPYMAMYLQDWAPDATKDVSKNMDFFEKGNMALQKAARDLSIMIEQQNPAYMLTDFRKLAVALQGLYNTNNGAFVSSIDKFLPAVQKLKKALAGGDENIVKPKEWKSFLILASRGYVQFLRYQYFITENTNEHYEQNAVCIFRTLEDVFATFEDLVNLKATGVVTTAEVNDLLRAVSKIWPSFVTSDALMTEVMKLKKLVFGGTVDNWTKQDFATGKSKLQNLRKISDLLFPYFEIYSLKWKPEKLSDSLASQMFQTAQDNLTQAAVLGAGLFEADYGYDDLTKLMTEVARLYPSKVNFDPDKITDSLRQYKNLFVYFKKKVFQDPSVVVKVKQWPKTLDLLQGFFNEFLYYQYFIQNEELMSDHFAIHANQWKNHLVGTFTNLLRALPAQQLSRSDLLDLFNELQKIDMMKTVKQTTAAKVLDFALNSILVNPKDRLENKLKPDAFNLKSLQVLQQELTNWLDVDVYLRGLVKGNSKISADGLRENIQLKLADKKISVQMREGLQETLRNLQTKYPMTYDSKGQLIIDKNNRYFFDSRSVAMLNITRMLSRLILRSGGEDLKRIEQYIGINQAEATKVFNPVKDVILDTGLIAVSPTFINSRFIEANIFLPNSNGDILASYEELTDLLATIFSGLTLNSKLEKGLSEDCFGGERPTGKVSFACVSDSYRRHLPGVMTATPQFLDFLRGVSATDWTRYMDGALHGAGQGPDKEGMALMEDVTLIPFVIQYIELVFLKYDINKNGYLQYEDAKLAFPLFEKLLTDLAQENIQKGYLSKDDMFIMFCYIINYGAPPDSVTDYLFKWLPWKGNANAQQAIATDRTKLAEIIGYISQKANQTMRIQDIESEEEMLSRH